MESDDLDTYIASRLDGEPVEDDGFTSAVAARLFRRRLRRQVVLGGTAALVSFYLWTAGVSLAPSSLDSTITLVVAVAMLCLVAACSLVWIGTEA